MMRKPAARTLVSVLVAGITVVAFSPMAMSTPAASVPVCGPSAPKFEANFTTIEGKSGRVARGFGTLRWSRGRLDYAIKSGHVIDVCLAQGDRKNGTEITVSGLRFRGPAQGSEDWPGLNLVGFGSARAQVAPDLGATGTNASLAVAAIGATLTISGAALVVLRGRRYRGGIRSTPIGMGPS
jgi:hypothetical protein